eukprot:Opistho-2@28220
MRGIVCSFRPFSSMSSSTSLSDDPGHVPINCSIAPTIPRRRMAMPAHRSAFMSDDDSGDDESDGDPDLDDISDGTRAHRGIYRPSQVARLGSRRRTRSLEAPLKLCVPDDAMDATGDDALAPVIACATVSGNRSLPHSPISRKRKATSQSVELDELETLSLGGDGESDVASVWVNHSISGTNERIRDVLLVIFSVFGPIADFYNPIGLPYAYISFQNARDASTAVLVFAERTASDMQHLLMSVTPECVPVVMTEIANIASVVKTSERALLRAKRQRLGSDTDGPRSGAPTGFVTVKELSHMENMGRDISAFAIVSPS